MSDDHELKPVESDHAPAWPAICLDCATAAVKLATRPEHDGSDLDG